MAWHMPCRILRKLVCNTKLACMFTRSMLQYDGSGYLICCTKSGKETPQVRSYTAMGSPRPCSCHLLESV